MLMERCLVMSVLINPMISFMQNGLSQRSNMNADAESGMEEIDRKICNLPM